MGNIEHGEKSKRYANMVERSIGSCFEPGNRIEISSLRLKRDTVSLISSSEEKLSIGATAVSLRNDFLKAKLKLRFLPNQAISLRTWRKKQVNEKNIYVYTQFIFKKKKEEKEMDIFYISKPSVIIAIAVARPRNWIASRIAARRPNNFWPWNPFCSVNPLPRQV